MSSDVQNTILAFIAVAALSLLIQTVGAIAVIVMARKAAKNLRNEMEHYRSTLTPILERAREVVEHVAPKVETAADELAVITTRLREQTAQIQTAANDIIARTQRQAGRVDQMLTAVFDGVERASTFVSEVVSKPVRQLSGVLASVRAVVETMRQPAPHRYPPAGGSRYPDGDQFHEEPTGGFRR
jgi:methyl-accepting chemotaxis protein